MARISASAVKWAVEQVNGGRSALEVAKELGCSEKTVRGYVAQWKRSVVLAASTAAAPPARPKTAAPAAPAAPAEKRVPKEAPPPAAPTVVEKKEIKKEDDEW